jgi:hypothetical protein
MLCGMTDLAPIPAVFSNANFERDGFGLATLMPLLPRGYDATAVAIAMMESGRPVRACWNEAAGNLGDLALAIDYPGVGKSVRSFAHLAPESYDWLVQAAAIYVERYRKTMGVEIKTVQFGRRFWPKGTTVYYPGEQHERVTHRDAGYSTILWNELGDSTLLDLKGGKELFAFPKWPPVEYSGRERTTFDGRPATPHRPAPPSGEMRSLAVIRFFTDRTPDQTFDLTNRPL